MFDFCVTFVNWCRRNCSPIPFGWQLWCLHIVDYKAVTSDFFSNLKSLVILSMEKCLQGRLGNVSIDRLKNFPETGLWDIIYLLFFNVISPGSAWNGFDAVLYAVTSCDICCDITGASVPRVPVDVGCGKTPTGRRG